MRTSILVVTFGALAIGCGDDGAQGGPTDGGPADSGSNDGGPNDAGSDGSVEDAGGEEDAGPYHAGPPEPGPENAPDGEGVTSFAVSRWYLGGTNREGIPNPEAWRDYGYDIDGLISIPSDTDLCQPAGGASADLPHREGVDGIDNSFGKNVLPILIAIDPSIESRINDAVSAGGPTRLISLVALGDGTDYRPLEARAYTSVDLGMAPRWDGSDEFMVDPAGLEAPADIESARSSFPDGYLVDDTWVSGAPADLDVTFSFSGFMLRLPLHAAVLSMHLDATHESAELGTVSGVVATADLVSAFRTYAGTMDAALCSGATIDSIVAQIELASDILADGTQDPGRTCDAISVGFGFDASGAVRSSIGTSPPPPPDPCL